jgi:hypothetical protein
VAAARTNVRQAATQTEENRRTEIETSVFNSFGPSIFATRLETSCGVAAFPASKQNRQTTI